MSTDDNATSVVVLVHGLYMNGAWMCLLRRRLGALGRHGISFEYPSLKRGVAANADALQEWLAAIQASHVDFVAHSLGGLVLRHLFHRHPGQRPGRVVTLGTPHRSSAAAGSVESLRLGRILGQSRCEGLLGGVPPWNPSVELGSIAGTFGFGIGRFFHRLGKPNDGAVAVSETRFDGMADHVVVPVAHAGLVFSKPVARLCDAFLRHGRFHSEASR